MRKVVFYIQLLVPLLCCIPGFAAGIKEKCTRTYEKQDSVDIQILYNGRAWRNIYYRVKGDQFLFSPDFLEGNLQIDGKAYNNLKLRYDIYKDELNIRTDRGVIIELNKEMIDQFRLGYNNKTYLFKKLESDSLNSLSGYVNVLYEGNVSLFVKYRKEILSLAFENKYDLFSQSSKTYVKLENKIFRVDSKGEFLNLLKDHKQQIRNFIRTNKIKMSKQDPGSYVPVIEYFDKKIQTSSQ